MCVCVFFSKVWHLLKMEANLPLQWSVDLAQENRAWEEISGGSSLCPLFDGVVSPQREIADGSFWGVVGWSATGATVLYLSERARNWSERGGGTSVNRVLHRRSPFRPSFCLSNPACVLTTLATATHGPITATSTANEDEEADQFNKKNMYVWMPECEKEEGRCVTWWSTYDIERWYI